MGGKSSRVRFKKTTWREKSLRRIHSTPPTYFPSLHSQINLENRTQVIHQTCVFVPFFSPPCGHQGSGAETSPSMIFLLDLLIVKHELLTQPTPRELKLQHFWLVLYKGHCFYSLETFPNITWTCLYPSPVCSFAAKLGLTCY